jgi:triacylglycerol esterase/lipase EstA (alpha/beta hydrolase family)
MRSTQSSNRRPGTRLAAVLTLLTLIGVAVSFTPPVGAESSAPAPAGPPLSVSQGDLERSLQCPGGLAAADRDVILLVPGTTLDPRTNFGYSWMREFEALGFPYCYVVMPDRSMIDMQVSSEHVVHAIREIHRVSGRKVDVIGHSQGGANPRWAMRWWPDTRSMVDDYIGLAPDVHGGKGVDALCADGDCAPAMWQQTYHSNLMRALNSGGETFPGVDYTVAWTRFDQFLTPPGEVTTIDGATNIALQDICPANTTEHVAIGTHDPISFAIMMDALTHPGPANPARIDRTVCTQALPPHVDPVTFPVDYAKVQGEIFTQLTLYPQVREEPPLKDYAADYPR